MGALLLAAGVGAATTAVVLVVLGVVDPLADEPVDEQVTLDPTLSSPTDEPATGAEPADEPATNAAAPTERATTPGEREAPADLAQTRRAVVRVQTGAGSGSGVVMSDRADGAAVVTSADLVDGGTDEPAEVILEDGRTVDAAVQGSDVVTNIAVLTLPNDDYPTAPLADTVPRPGGGVTLISRLEDGSTGSLDGAVASSSWRVEREDLPALNGLLQISTPGESIQPGGPVVNSQNRVVGIVAGSAGDWHQATPIDVATKIGEDILDSGEARHARLGIEGYDVAETPGGDDTRGDAGVYIAEVIEDSPAAAHLQAGDVIVTLGGVPITDIAALQSSLLVHSPGDEVAITYYRGADSDPETASVTLDAAR
jgi:S1-C subfamily serine protease